MKPEAGVIRRALGTSLVVSGACEAVFGASKGVTLAGVIGSVCVAVVVSSVVKRGVVLCVTDALVVSVCVILGTLFFLSAFPGPALAMLRAPGLLALRTRPGRTERDADRWFRRV